LKIKSKKKNNDYQRDKGYEYFHQTWRTKPQTYSE
jgi:hypothetical protein